MGLFPVPHQSVHRERLEKWIGQDRGYTLYTRRFTLVGDEFVFLGRCYGCHPFAAPSNTDYGDKWSESITTRYSTSERPNETYLFPVGYPAS